MVWPTTLSSVTCSPTCHLHLEHEMDLDRVVEVRRTNAAGEMSLAEAIEQAPVLGRAGARNVLLAGCSLMAYFW